MKSGRSLVDLARELERQLATKKDMVVPSSLMFFRTSEQGVSSIDIEENRSRQNIQTEEWNRRRSAQEIGPWNQIEEIGGDDEAPIRADRQRCSARDPQFP